jgi:hypothetical protein
MGLRRLGQLGFPTSQGISPLINEKFSQEGLGLHDLRVSFDDSPQPIAGAVQPRHTHLFDGQPQVDIGIIGVEEHSLFEICVVVVASFRDRQQNEIGQLQSSVPQQPEHVLLRFGADSRLERDTHDLRVNQHAQRVTRQHVPIVFHGVEKGSHFRMFLGQKADSLVGDRTAIARNRAEERDRELRSATECFSLSQKNLNLRPVLVSLGDLLGQPTHGGVVVDDQCRLDLLKIGRRRFLLAP